MTESLIPFKNTEYVAFFSQRGKDMYKETVLLENNVRRET